LYYKRNKDVNSVALSTGARCNAEG